MLALDLCHLAGAAGAAQADPPAESLDARNRREFLAWPLLAVIQAYRTFLGKGIRSTCPMHPSCSTYGKQAVERTGARGFLDVVDRLNRCGHDLSRYRIVRRGGALLYDDPPEAR